MTYLKICELHIHPQSQMRAWTHINKQKNPIKATIKPKHTTTGYITNPSLSRSHPVTCLWTDPLHPCLSRLFFSSFFFFPFSILPPPRTMGDELQKRNTDCVYFLASPLTCKKVCSLNAPIPSLSFWSFLLLFLSLIFFCFCFCFLSCNLFCFLF